MTNAGPSSFIPLPRQEELKRKYVGTPINALPTPSLLIDRSKVVSNIEQMQRTVSEWRCLFRAHIKTHKTPEIVALQLSNSDDRAIIVSTLAEAWGVIESGLVKEKIVDDILYGVPIATQKITELLQVRVAMRSASPTADVKLLVDNVEQVEALQKQLEENDQDTIYIFIKIDGGYKRAGLPPDSLALLELVRTISRCNLVAIHGVYTHAGLSYSSSTSSMASSFLQGELQCVNDAALVVSKVLQQEGDTVRHHSPLVLSVGSTPTAHAAGSRPTDELLSKLKRELCGSLEIHCGNYPILDLQQMATGAIPTGGIPPIERCAITVLTSVVSIYPKRGSNGTVSTDEALCDAGGIAMSKDTGQYAGYGHVIWPRKYIGWGLGRISQEHGVLTIREGGSKQWGREWGTSLLMQDSPNMLQVGDTLQVVPQHACMVAASHPWMYIYDSSRQETIPTVLDIWIPWKGW